MATPGKPEKTMSSRLLTMKFMQRAAATSPSSASDSPEGRPSKRARLSQASAEGSPSSDLKAVQAALAAEELKRTEALQRRAEEAGDTKWTLNVADAQNGFGQNGLNVVRAGYNAIDSQRFSLEDQQPDKEEDDDVGTVKVSGRRSFGRFNKALEKQQNPDREDTPSASDGSDESGSGSNDDDEEEGGSSKSKRTSASDAGDEARARRKAKRKAERQEALQLAERRRSKEVKLNRLTSISNAGSGRGQGSPQSSGQACFNCGSTGHKKKDCPKGHGRSKR